MMSKSTAPKGEAPKSRFSLPGNLASISTVKNDDIDVTPAEIETAERVAQSVGFNSTEPRPTAAQPSPATASGSTNEPPAPTLQRAKDPKDPIVQMSVRLPYSYSERLKAYASSERYSYGELIQLWMDEKKIGQ